MDHILSNPRLYQVYIIKTQTFANNPPMKLKINKNENRITFKIKIQYNLELLMLETMELLGTTGNENQK